MYLDSLNKQTHANLIQTYESAIDIFALRVTWNYDYIPSKNFKMINQRKAVYLESPVHPIPSPLNTYIHLFNCISVLTHFIWKWSGIDTYQYNEDDVLFKFLFLPSLDSAWIHKKWKIFTCNLVIWIRLLKIKIQNLNIKVVFTTVSSLYFSRLLFLNQSWELLHCGYLLLICRLIYSLFHILQCNCTRNN